MKPYLSSGFYILLLFLTACHSNKPDALVSGLKAEYNTLEDSTIELDARAEQADEMSVVSWKQLSGPDIVIIDDGSARLRISIPDVSADTSAELEVTLANERGEQVTDTTLVRIFNRVALPTDFSSLDQRLLDISLLTAGSHDASTEFEWTLIAGDGLDLNANGETAQITIPQLTEEQRDVTLQVTATNRYNVSSRSTTSLHLIKDQAATIAAVGELLSSLQAQAGAISLIPGETGDPGPVGIKGEMGEPGAPATKWTSTDAELWLQQIKDAPDYRTRKKYTAEEFRDIFTTQLDRYQRYIGEISTLLEEIEVERK
ncbi:MAG: hypothetical protein P8X89_08530 [Reinekea sp.]